MVEAATTQFDVFVENQGTIAILIPLTDTCREWLDENLLDPVTFGRGYVVEHRYVWPIIEGMIDDGIAVH
jgi:hypothetical protein